MSNFDIVAFRISCFMYIYLNVDKHSLEPAKLSCPARPPRRLVVSFTSSQTYIYLSNFHDFDICYQIEYDRKEIKKKCQQV